MTNRDFQKALCPLPELVARLLHGPDSMLYALISLGQMPKQTPKSKHVAAKVKGNPGTAQNHESLLMHSGDYPCLTIQLPITPENLHVKAASKKRGKSRKVRF